MIRSSVLGAKLGSEPPATAPRSRGEWVIPTQKRRHFSPTRSVGVQAILSTPARRRPNGLAPQTTPPKRSRGLGNPTALAEVDRGLPDGLKLVPDLGIGVQIGLYLSADLIPGLAFEAGEEVVHVGVEG